jgi:hypothetical protein
LRLQDLDPEGYQAFLQRQPDYQDYIKFRDTSSTDIRRHMDYSDWSRYKKFDPQHLENIMSGSSQPQQPTSAPAVPPQMINGVSVDQIASLIGRRNGTTF